MNDARLRKRFVLSLALLTVSMTLFVFTSWSWLTTLFQEDVDVEVGFVDVALDAYFWDGSTRIEAEEVEIDTGVYKPGVYLIDITSNTADNFFENFRLYFEVASNVDTYIRVKLYEQLTLTYVNYEGDITELSILSQGYMPFDYETTNWYDNRLVDNYQYYRLAVQRVDETTPYEIGLITAYELANFAVYSPGYSLQIAFSVEAVQAEGGPENVWGLSVPPWGGSW
ncbi:MAG: hypothetical protein WC509_06855 [Candidatus Izemoplasmatales bacterium]